MDFRDFLNQDLSVIKQELNLELLKQKHHGNTILDYLVEDNSLSKVKYIFEFCNYKCPFLFLEKNNGGRTFLHYLIYCNNFLHIIKYLFKFSKCRFPSLFLEKDNFGYTILHYLNFETFCNAKIILKFCILHYPYLFLEKNMYGNTFFSGLFYRNSFSSKVKYIINFCSLNYPEISRTTNNFILPLFMEIQN